MRPTRIAVWIATLALVAATVLAYPGLPDVIPKNLDIKGAASTFAPKTPFNWGMPLIIGIAVLIMTDVITALIPGRVHLINIPGKEQLVALPREYQSEAVAMTQRFMDVMNLYIVLTFALVQWGMWRTAHGSPQGSVSIVLLVLGVVPLFMAGFFVIRIQSAVDDAQRRYESRRNPLKA